VEGTSAPGKASRYWDTYFKSHQGGPPLGRGGYPAVAEYKGERLLTDNSRRHFMSSFIPQFCWFQTKAFHADTYYSQSLFPAWLAADQQFWAGGLNSSSEVWGHRVAGRVFGCVTAQLLVRVRVRVRVEIMGPGKYGIVGKSQSVLTMINPIIFTRTRSIREIKLEIKLEIGSAIGHLTSPMPMNCDRCGAGQSPSGYGVDRISDDFASTEGVFSAAIMAGFLGAAPAGSAARARINAQLQWLYANGVCRYSKTLPSGEVVQVLIMMP
jgi:hypothetical protein